MDDIGTKEQEKEDALLAAAEEFAKERARPFPSEAALAMARAKLLERARDYAFLDHDCYTW